MVAGLNLCARIWDYQYDLGSADDEVGGAVPSGTVLQENLEMRIASQKPVQALLDQGIESGDMYTGVIANYTIDVLNNHEIEIIAPANSPYFGKFFRVIGNPRRASSNPSDSRGFLLVSLRRVEKSRTIQ